MPQNKIANPSFEKDAVSSGSFISCPPNLLSDWTTSARAIDIHDKGHWSMGVPIGGGDKHVDINPDGRIEQLITGLKIGDTCYLSFYTSVHHYMVTGCGSTGGNASMRVSFGTMFSTTLSLIGSDKPWAKKSFSFIATATSANLVFEGIGSCYVFGGILIDQLELIQDMSNTCNSTKRFAYAGKDTSICMSKTGNATINLNASGGVSYKWSPTSFFADPNKSSVSASISGTTDFVVEVTDSLGFKDKDTISIKLLPLPKITVTPNPISECIGKSVTLTASGAAFYQWSPAINFLPTTGAKTSLTISPNETNYFVKGIDENGCSDVDTIRVNILAGPIVSAMPKDTMGCYGIAIRLNASGAQTFRWFPPVDFDNDTLKNPLLYISSNSKYIVEGTDSKGCKGYDTISIKGLPLPVVKLSLTSRKNQCDSSIVELLATGANTYSWSPSIFCETPLSDRTLVKVGYDIVMKVVGKNEFGCSSEDTVFVRKEGEFKITMPNAFTPNDDGINDKIRPMVFCNFKLIEFSIYNRWGQMVLSTKSLKKSWDGTFNGLPCNMDVYYYLIRGLDQNEKEVIDKGDITLVR